MLLHDVVIAQHASEKAVLDEGAISELRGVYPDAHMIDDLGDALARGLWARHVHGRWTKTPVCKLEKAVLHHWTKARERYGAA